MWTKFDSTLTNPVEENISLACGPLFLGELFGRSFALRGRENNRVCIPVQSLVVRDAGPLCVCVVVFFRVIRVRYTRVKHKVSFYFWPCQIQW